MVAVVVRLLHQRRGTNIINIFHIGILSYDTCKMVPEIQFSSNHNCWLEIMGKTWNNNLDRQIGGKDVYWQRCYMSGLKH